MNFSALNNRLFILCSTLIIVGAFSSCSGTGFKDLIDRETEAFNTPPPDSAILYPHQNEYLSYYQLTSAGTLEYTVPVLQGNAVSWKGENITDDAAYSWNSDIDGLIGAGRQCSLSVPLTPGIHEITLTVKGDLNMEDNFSVFVHVPVCIVEDFSDSADKDASATTAVWSSGSVRLSAAPRYYQMGSYSETGVNAVLSSGNTVFAGDASGIVNFLDVSINAYPRLISSVTLDSKVYGMCFRAPYLYCATIYNGLYIIDSADTNNVINIPAADDEMTRDICMDESYLYAAFSGYGLRVFSLTDPANPAEAGAAQIPGSYTALYCIAKEGNRIYMGGESLLYISDVADPASPGTVSSVPFQGDIYALGTKNGLLAAGTDAGIGLFSLAAPDSPALQSFYTTNGRITSIKIKDNRLYYVENGGGLFILDISQPASPVLIGSYTASPDPFALSLGNDVAYLSDTYSGTGVQVINLKERADMKYIGSYKSEGVAYQTCPVGNVLFIANGSGGLLTLNTEDPTHPSLLSTLALNEDNDVVSIAYKDGYVYAACEDAGLIAVDVRDPENPVIAGSLFSSVTGNAVHISLSGNYALITDENNRVVITDISNPSALRVVSSSNTGNDYSYATAISGIYVYTASGSDGVFASTVSSSGILSSSASLNPNSDCYYGVAASGKNLFISGDSYISSLTYDPAASMLQELHSLSISAPARQICLYDGFLVAAQTFDGIVSYDISNPSLMSKSGALRQTGISVNVVPQDPYIFSSNMDKGIAIVGMQKRYSDMFITAEEQVAQSKTFSGIAASSARVITASSAHSQNLTIELSNDGGSHWHAIGTGTRMIFPGSSGNGIAWRARLRSVNSYVSPEITALAIELWNE